MKPGVALGFLLLATALAQEPRIDLTDWPVRLTAEAQLFVDDSLIARQSGVRWKPHQPVKHPANPLVEPTPEWERLVLAYGSVLRDPLSRLFRMWYTNDVGIAYAESVNGVRWRKPPVGMAINGHATNVLTRGHRGRSDTLTVFLNPDASDPERQYLAYVFEYRFPDKDGVREQRREGIYLRTSPDGIRWIERPAPVMYSMWRNREDRPGVTDGDLGDVNHVAWDPKLRKFVGHVKLSLGGIRMRGMTESDDGIHWTTPRLIMKADEGDRPGDQTYSMIAFPYESLWLGFVGLYHKETTDRMDIQLAFSRDGRNWGRPYREPFLANGADGAWDWGVLHMGANAPLRVGDRLYIYYGGYQTPHNVRLRDAKRFGIGLATLRPDGFVSVEADESRGLLTTRPLTFAGSRLHLNAAVRHPGRIRVAVLRGDYEALDGYSLDEAVPVSGDKLDHVVRWRQRGDLGGARAAGHIRLQFELQDAALYSFRID